MTMHKSHLSSIKLQKQNLVLLDEQPYDLPENWEWATLALVLLKLTDGSHFSPRTINNGFPYVTVRDLSNGVINFEKCKYISKEDFNILFNNGCQPLQDDVLFSKDGTVGKTALVNFDKEFVVLSSLAILRSNKKIIFPEYLERCLNAPQIYEQAIGSKTGTAIKRIVLKNLKNIVIPLPPLSEQQRIVERIDNLFEKLDHAKELVQNALDSFENRKSAILHQAFTGELTKKWRQENSIDLEKWQKRKISEICTVVRGGSPRPAGDPQFYGGNIPFLKVADITKSSSPFLYSAEHSITESGLRHTRLVDANTLLLTNSGATLGVPGICTFPTTFNDGVAAFIGLNESSLKFYYYFWTSKTNEMRSINKGAAQPNLNTNIIGSVTVNCPSLKEQLEIVRILDDYFEKEEKAKELYDVIGNIDLMKKAILARAFRGDLGTNVPSEPCSTELINSLNLFEHN